jgi:hypothetical protein
MRKCVITNLLKKGIHHLFDYACGEVFYYIVNNIGHPECPGDEYLNIYSEPFESISKKLDLTSLEVEISLARLVDGGLLIRESDMHDGKIVTCYWLPVCDWKLDRQKQ